MPPAHPVDPTLEFLARFHVAVGPVQHFGHTPWGHRRVIDITGGHFEGPNLRGQIISGGADWQLIRLDGSTSVDTRYSLSTDDGANIHIRTSGYRAGDPAILDALLNGADVDPHDYYFRITAAFETSAPAYACSTTSSASAPAHAPLTRSCTTPTPSGELLMQAQSVSCSFTTDSIRHAPSPGGW